METTPDVTTIHDGRYELVRRVGRGSSGAVWLARDRELGRDVAIKRAGVPVHLAEHERDRIRKRLEREARAAARLHGSGVVPLFDVHIGDDTVDLVMAFIDAPTLRELVADGGPLPDDVAAGIGLTVLEVLVAAHAEGVIHRDVKPSNILVGDDGVRVTDFGIAAMTDETELTTTGTALGSPSYIPPEQAEGLDAAPAADLWGLGATLYYTLTGEPPFARDRALATLHAVISQPHEPIDPARHPLAPLIDDLLQKDPAARPSAAEIRRRLRAVADADGSQATRELPVMAAPPVDAGPLDATPGPSAADVAMGTAVVDDGEPEEGSSTARKGVAIAAVVAVGLGAAFIAGDLPSLGEDPQVALPSATEGPSATAPTGTGGEDDEPPAEPVAGVSEDGATSDDGTTPGDGQASDDADTPDDSSEGGQDTPDRDASRATVPDGWQVHEGATYRVAVPEGWEVRDDTGNRTDLVDPSTGAYLRVDWTDEPESDPEADWEAKSEGFSRRYPDYDEIRIDAVDYREYPAALWEYTYATSGSRFHAYNLGFVAEDHGYALNFQTPADDWDEMVDLFEGFRASFDPTP